MASDGYVSLLVEPNGNINTPDAAWPDFTSDFRVRLDVAPVTWASGGTRVLYASDASPNGWYLALTAGGSPLVRLYNGSTNTQFAPPSAFGFTAGLRRQIEASIDLVDGANTVVTFRYRDPGDPGIDLTDDTGWTTHGTGSATAVSLTAASTIIRIGCRADFAVGVTGNYFQGAAWSGLGTSLVSWFDCRDPVNAITGRSVWDDLQGTHNWTVSGTQGTHWSYTEPVAGGGGRVFDETFEGAGTIETWVPGP